MSERQTVIRAAPLSHCDARLRPDARHRRAAYATGYGFLLGLLSAVAPVYAADSQASLAIFQHLIETAPGEYTLKEFSLSAATGSDAAATVTTFTDADGVFRGALTGAAAGAGVNDESPFHISPPSGWTIDTRVASPSAAAPAADATERRAPQ